MFGMCKYFLYLRYPLYFSAIYIYLYVLGVKGVFNNNFIIVFTIVSSYEFINIPYYFHLASNLEYL